MTLTRSRKFKAPQCGRDVRARVAGARRSRHACLLRTWWSVYDKREGRRVAQHGFYGRAVSADEVEVQVVWAGEYDGTVQTKYGRFSTVQTKWDHFSAVQTR